MTDYKYLKKELTEVSDFLIALGDEKRQAIIIRLLEEMDCKGMSVTVFCFGHLVLFLHIQTQIQIWHPNALP